jgi:ABC-type anion transport system duplicated permease subunit
MTYDTRPAVQSRAVGRSDYGLFGLGANVSEAIMTGTVVAIAVTIVALISGLMTMD